MNSRRNNIVQSFDWITIGIYIVMLVLGWLGIYAASYDFVNTDIFDFSLRHGKQLVWILMALIIALILLFLDDKIYDLFAYPVYLFVVLLLIATLFLAPDIKGSRSWLVLGPVSLQPVEFAKFATALALAKLMSTYGFRISSLKNILLILLIIGLPMLIVVEQKETGSALVFLAFSLVLYREGMSGLFLFIGICAVLVFIISIRYSEILFSEMTAFGELEVLGRFLIFFFALIIQYGIIFFYQRDTKAVKRSFIGIVIVWGITFLLNQIERINIPYTYVAIGIVIIDVIYCFYLSFYYRRKTYLLSALFLLASIGFAFSVDFIFSEVLKPHQQVRIKVTLGMEEDPTGAGYNVEQSKIAIGSGGFWGKGFLNGTQTKLKYVPEQETDFIFCTIGEEKGFVGTTLVLLLYLGLLLRLIFLAERQKSTFSRIYGYSVVSILFFHLAINVGMVIGLAPVIGIPLPFFSYGGSSLWGFTILLFIFLRLDAARIERL